MEAANKQFRKRSAILTCLRQSEAHPSAQMVYDQLRETHPDISLATVYRNLVWFRNQGTIQSLGTVDGIERFDARTDPHAHFVCTRCGAVLDLPEVALPDDREALTAKGLLVQSCRLTYTGLCQNCQNSVEAP